jgi:GrpB-like predicted nucleotidyltransferase (UPF0157 family)
MPVAAALTDGVFLGQQDYQSCRVFSAISDLLGLVLLPHLSKGDMACQAEFEKAGGLSYNDFENNVSLGADVRPTVIIFDYDSQWPVLFEEERGRILHAVGQVILAIEHVGSTAVPGLGAKPIVDIMVGVHSLADAKECIEPLGSIGYKYHPENEDSIPERRYFQKGPNDTPNQHFHLHMVEIMSDFWKRTLLFRDLLRTHPEEAQQYYQLKKELAVTYGSDRNGYTNAKTSFIESVIGAALGK